MKTKYALNAISYLFLCCGLSERWFIAAGTCRPQILAIIFCSPAVSKRDEVKLSDLPAGNAASKRISKRSNQDFPRPLRLPPELQTAGTLLWIPPKRSDWNP